MLTSNIYGEKSFIRDISALSTERGISIEVRQAKDGVLHDRYIIHDEGMLLLGASLNGLGKKQSFIVPMGDDIRKSTASFFNNLWANSRKFK